MLTNTPQWVAIYTLSRSEKKVAERLEKENYETYLPIVEVKHKWSDRMKLVKEPLFRSYVFAKIRNTDVSAIRNIAGVVFIVSFQREIEVIPDEEIEAIKRFIENKQEIAIHETQQLKKGAVVKITEGHFAGMQGTLIKNCKDGNFAIRINALGLSIVTTVDKLTLEVLSEPSAKKKKI